MRLIAQENLTNLTANIKIPAGNYKEFVLHYSGTNGATAVAAADLGTARLTFRGRQIQFVSIDRLQAINNLKGGAILFSSTASGALDAVAFLPQAVPGDLLNVLHVDNSDNVYLELNFSTAGGLVASGTVSIYGVERDGVQKYFNMLNNYDVTLGSGIYRERMPFENIYEIFIENDSALDRLHIFKDGSTVADAAKTALQALTNFENFIETYSSSLSYIDLELAKTKQLDESLSDDVSVEYSTSASATLNNVVNSIDFAPQQMITSEVSRSSIVNQRLQRKTVSGKTRPARVIHAGLA